MRKIEVKKRWKFESYIGWHRSWWDYYNHYREATIVLVKSVDERTPIDTVSLPILFLIRHSLELGLKANILELEKFSDAKPKLKFDGKSHQLVHLYEYFIAHLNKIIIDYNIPPETVSEIRKFDENLLKLTDRLADLDKGSYNFRYPVDTNGNNNFEWNDKLNIVEFTELIQEIDSFILFTTNVLAECGVVDMDEIMGQQN